MHNGLLQLVERRVAAFNVGIVRFPRLIKCLEPVLGLLCRGTDLGANSNALKQLMTTD